MEDEEPNEGGGTITKRISERSANGHLITEKEVTVSGSDIYEAKVIFDEVWNDESRDSGEQKKKSAS